MHDKEPVLQENPRAKQAVLKLKKQYAHAKTTTNGAVLTRLLAPQVQTRTEQELQIETTKWDIYPEARKVCCS